MLTDLSAHQLKIMRQTTGIILTITISLASRQTIPVFSAFVQAENQHEKSLRSYLIGHT
jgi:hypothetical protein